jgi:methylated-DNA-protein-cysteine methyltransferase-like protein
MTDSTRGIIEQILSIPRGKVSSYRDIALFAGIPNGARQTVRVLHSMSEKYNLPWHRIIRSNGSIALKDEGKILQITLLRSEGVKVSDDGWVDMAKYGLAASKHRAMPEHSAMPKHSFRKCKISG